MTSNASSTQRSAEGRRPVQRVALITHGRADQVGSGVERLAAVARDAGVELVVSADEAARHGLAEVGDPATADLAVVLGGDGTMLRALRTFLGTGIPVLGVNFGRVGFLSAVQKDDLEAGVGRALAGEIEVVELPTLEVVNGGMPHVA